MSTDPDELENQYRALRYSHFVKDRDRLRTNALEISGRYDKAVLTLTGGALAVSITFLKDIAPDPVPETLWLVGSAWVLLIGSIFLQLYAMATSQTAKNAQIELLDEEYRSFLRGLGDQGKVSTPPNEPPTEAEVENYRKLTRWSNNAAVWLLGAGIAFLCAFSIANVVQKQRKTAYEQRQNQIQGDLGK